MENDSLIGTQLGAYFIQTKLGEGGMAQVYKAYHARLRREVAIKVILPQIADKAGFRDRFEREAQVVASLEHRNIVAVYDFGEIGNLTYLVMQYVGGGTLRDLLRRDGKIEPHRAVQYAIQMARALHHAHQRGIVHRDVKPQNMLISSSDPNEILLSDFGIAKLFDSQETIITSYGGNVRNDPSLTSTDQMVGTAEYMAPEQITRQAVDARTDVYALGIVLFQMLTGQIPFSASTVQGLLFQHVYTPPKLVREINPSIPPVVEQIIAKALAKAPEHRYQSAEAMAVALEATYTAPTHPFTVDNYSTHGRPTADVLTYPTPSRPNQPVPPYYSDYGQQPVAGASAISINDPATRTTTVGSGNIAVPIRPQAKRKFRLSYIMYSVFTVIAIVLLLSRLQPWLCTTSSLFCLGSSSQTSPGTNTSFTTEDFHNNDHNWTIGYLDNGNLKADISNNQYTLTVGSVDKTYFPHPLPMGAADGPLPQNFTLTVEMAQTQGDIYRFFGIAFRLQGDDSHVSSYGFAVKRAGQYELLKYTVNNMSTLKEGVLPAQFNESLNQFNTLQVTVQGNKFFFKVNDQLVLLDGSADHSFTDNDHPLTGGQLGIYVTGPDASFTVRSVKLTTP
jgi:serine/threonine-protein kinase